MKNPSRRSFLKISALSIASLPFIGGALSGFSNLAKAADPVLTPVKENEGQAKVLGYCKDAEKSVKSKTSTCAPRKAKEHAGELCRNCQLYTKTQGDGKTEMGKCVVMPANLVYATGWCNSYSKKFT